MCSKNNELYHHGIKGMRWGVRRFQKKDGTLTNAGKKRYDDEDGCPIGCKKICASEEPGINGIKCRS